MYTIYKAENCFTGEVYIGATTKSLKERQEDHFYKAIEGKNGYFYDAIRTYGFEAFKWDNVDFAYTINELADKETGNILKFDSVLSGYNSNRGGGFKKTVYQFDIGSGNMINSFDSLENAANAVNANKRSISNACLGINKSCKGFAWSYFNEFNSFSDKRKKQVNQYSPDGNLVNSFESASDASRITGFSKTCIARCCRGEREQSGNFFWKYS